MFEQSVSYLAAFSAGLLSFFTPCVLPLVPVYFTIITGVSLDQLTSASRAELRRKIIVSTIFFVAGFSLVFVLLGASASFIGSFLQDYRHYVKIVGGIIIIILGLHLSGAIRIPAMQMEKRALIKNQSWRLFGVLVAGMAFAAGWTPCIGPILGSILILAGSQENITNGIMLLSLYSLGLALPFLLLSIFINFLLVFLRRINRIIRYINPIAGVLLIAAGIYLIFS